MQNDILQVFAQHGVPTLILAFILWFILKPLTSAAINFIGSQTKLLQELVHNQESIVNELREMKTDLHDIKQDLDKLKKL